MYTAVEKANTVYLWTITMICFEFSSKKPSQTSKEQTRRQGSAFFKVDDGEDKEVRKKLE